MSITQTPPSRASVGSNHRWLILAVLAIAQLMVVLDATIVNIALPEAQQALGFSDGQRQWVITAYSLAFGSLLLIGGRINDLFGRKNSFIVGLIGFAAASALGGWSPTFEVLVTARALQGVFGALLAPAALSLLAVTFAGSEDRGKAFGIFGAVAGAGGAIGLLLGGVLTEYVSWNWCLYVNVIFAIIAMVGAIMLLPKHIKDGARTPIDWAGTILVTAGLFLIVYGFANSETNGWTDAVTVLPLVIGIVLLAAFLWVQTQVSHPLLPLHILLDRMRGASYLVMLIAAIGMFAVFLFLTFYLQQTLGFSPVETGLAFLPMVGSIAITAAIAGSVLVTRLSPKVMVAAGLTVSALGMVFLTTIETDSSYVTGVVPGLIMIGIGLGTVFANAMSLSTYGVQANDAGVASATVNTAQQVGGSIGVALLSSFAATAGANYVSDHGPAGPDGIQAIVDGAAMAGYHAAFWWAAGFFALGALVAGVVYPNKIPEIDPNAEPVIGH
ncbi:UNVERIFIED_CONTAM: EmrB/QacA subfamily drug resistance transporter [Williamsia faeni]